ncbi:L-lactate dehydrogenase complex protein LldG [Pseudarcicella hirudinis]|uniref:L-lactate dehydrogenase complex protein LldG n=1 Tax=Pseudarcicella hirudinis TaxID=1079859 RepID=A0A1I5XXA4_9BACT|nr:LUD domain-containing protein [Pseudarcicella hirudinis]SFQ36555.1 L-lactate dehydrogenase complex protein LldG [Pseudarcicella hirudinis]
MSRENILAGIKKNQPENRVLPVLTGLNQSTYNPLEQFKTVLQGIGGEAIEVGNYQEIKDIIAKNYQSSDRIITTLPDFGDIAENNWQTEDPHTLENVELCIIRAHFGVAENSALWVTEDILGLRVAPFICQNLAVIIPKNEIEPTMHEAYKRIAMAEYGFGTFIAGPSKTADIEQSLVLGAHGSKSMVVFLVG